MKLAGVYPIVPTPFTDDGVLDPESMDRLVEFLSPQGIRGFAILGALGEGHKLSAAERSQVIERYCQVMPPDLDLVVGVRAPATDPAMEMARSAAALGADALLLGPHGVQNDNALLTYYQRVAGEVEIPVIIHDYPAVTGITMSVELIARIFESAPNIQYIKLEDPPTGAKMQALAKLTGPELEVFGALGGMYALEELELGAVGIMTGFVFAGLLVKLYDLVKAGDLERAASLFYDFVPLNRWEFQPKIGVSLRKRVLQRLGVFESAHVRHPGPDADDKTVKQMLRMVEHLKKKGYQL